MLDGNHKNSPAQKGLSSRRAQGTVRGNSSSTKRENREDRSLHRVNEEFPKTNNPEIGKFRAPLKEKEKDHRRNAESGEYYYGLNTCKAFFHNSAETIIRAYVTEDRLSVMAHLLKWCAKRKKPYHIVSSEDLARITKSVHHEGVAIFAKAISFASEEDFWSDLSSDVDKAKNSSKNKQPLIYLYLDGVVNPHNIGSIMRTSAHFGSKWILGQLGSMPKLSPSAIRVSEGGFSFVQPVVFQNPKDAFDRLRREFGFEIIAATKHERGQKFSQHENHSLSLFDLKSKPVPSRAIVIMGNEVSGISKEIKKESQKSVYIPGVESIDSLNVAVASGIFLAEHTRTYRNAK